MSIFGIGINARQRKLLINFVRGVLSSVDSCVTSEELKGTRLEGSLVDLTAKTTCVAAMLAPPKLFNISNKKLQKFHELVCRELAPRLNPAMDLVSNVEANCAFVAACINHGYSHFIHPASDNENWVEYLPQASLVCLQQVLAKKLFADEELPMNEVVAFGKAFISGYMEIFAAYCNTLKAWDDEQSITVLGDDDDAEQKLSEAIDKLESLSREAPYHVVNWCRNHLEDGYVFEGKVGLFNVPARYRKWDGPYGITISTRVHRTVYNVFFRDLISDIDKIVQDVAMAQEAESNIIDNTINDKKTVADDVKDVTLAGRYHILRQLGQGGMGAVWLAEDQQLDNRKVAIKMLPTIIVQDKRAYQQLKSEALVSLKLIHPNIVTLRVFEENDGAPFLVMDYVEGYTLSDYIAEKGKLTEEETIRLLKPIAKALDYAHSEKVIHRDVKPSNILIRNNDGHPFILDFGIAREIQESLTRVTGRTISGTLLYMSPEQLRGALPKPAQDIYSFSVMAYECLNGDPPFMRGEIAYQIINEPPAPLAGDSQLVASIMAGLAKRPQDRPKTCTGVLECRESSLRSSHKDVANHTKLAIRAYKDKDYVRAFAIAQKADKEDAEIQNILGHCFAEGWGCIKDECEAVKWFRKAAIQGHAWAQSNLGVMLAKGRGVKKDDVESVKWFRRAAEQGKAAAQYYLGMAYAKGRGIKKDEADAVKWYRKAAEQGYAAAQCDLGIMYECGCGVAKNEEEAVKWFRKAAEKGYAIAQNRLGTMYEEGCGVAEDYVEAIKWYRMAAEQGNAYAQNNLGWMYKNGLGVEKDEVKASQWYSKAAEQGLSEAQCILGRMYADGNGVAKDEVKAAYWIRKAAEQGVYGAQWHLGSMYEEGKGVVKDEAKAVHWYSKAAEQGYDLAQYDLGKMYERGKGVVKDEVEAIKWYQMAAKKGYVVAQNHLGMMYENGRGVAKDIAEAVKWYRKAADQGMLIAQCNLGLIYANEQSVENGEEAVKWFLKAAEEGYAPAQYNLGVMYAKGRGIKKDDVEAVNWFRKAAEQGDASALHGLGCMYASGDGVKKDTSMALMFYRKAAEKGYGKA